MKLIRLLIVFFLLSGGYSNMSVAYAADVDKDTYDWMKASWDSITNFIPRCLEVPEFIDLNHGFYLLNLDNTGEWVATGNYVEKDKLLQFKWFTKDVQSRPDKYRVLYRIDPRFPEPQVFIQKYNYDTDTYISDFHQFKSGKFLNYQATPEMTFLRRIEDFANYFQFQGDERSKIAIKKDDVINITIDTGANYFGTKSEMNSELGTGDELLLIYTESSIPDNRIIYSNAKQFCTDAIKASSSEYSDNCALPSLYWDVGQSWQTFEGRISNTAFDRNKDSINSCADGTDGRDNNPLCYYDKGRGMTFKVGGTIIKPAAEKFITSSASGKDFFYYKSDVSGDLDFTTQWDIDDMYNHPKVMSQYMQQWDKVGSNYTDFKAAIIALQPHFSMKYLHFGRYFLDIEVGNSVTTVPQSDLDAIKVEYKIMESGAPDSSTEGTEVDKYSKGNAPDSGYLWIRVIRPSDNMTGSVRVETLNYTGSTWFSDVVYGELIKPLRENFNNLSKMIYLNLVGNAALQNIAQVMLILYIMIYGLMFLAGATQITVNDIVIRVLKISIILALFSETSWTFFNDKLFKVFVEGTDYLLHSVIGVTSSATNIFGFVDPIFDKYTNPTIWGLLFVQFLQFGTGLTFFAMMTMYSLVIYLVALVEVIVGYCLAFLGLAVMISIAPLFIMLILFERTRSIFDNWISTIFSYMIRPTILLIFFLLIDQIISEQILQAVVKSCWKLMVPIKISLDLNHIDIPISFSFTLPALPGVVFYIPQLQFVNLISDFFLQNGTFVRIATSSLILFSLCKLSKGLVEYTSLLVQYLTNVLAARQDGALQHNKNPIQDIVSDMNKFNLPGSAMKFAKEKFIDQKISHVPSRKKVEDIDYSDVNKKEKNDQKNKE